MPRFIITVMHVQLVGTTAGPFVKIKALALRLNGLPVSSDDRLSHTSFYRSV